MKENSSVFLNLTNLFYTLNSRSDVVNFDRNISHQPFFERGFKIAGSSYTGPCV